MSKLNPFLMRSELASWLAALVAVVGITISVVMMVIDGENRLVWVTPLAAMFLGLALAVYSIVWYRRRRSKERRDQEAGPYDPHTLRGPH